MKVIQASAKLFRMLWNKYLNDVKSRRNSYKDASLLLTVD